MLAEWDSRMTATLIAWPHSATDWAPMLPEIDQCYVELADALLHAGQKIVIVTPEPSRIGQLLKSYDRNNILLVHCETNDTWTRDYGPVTVEHPPETQLRATFFGFNGWGLKFAADKDNLVGLKLKAQKVIDCQAFDRKSYVLEGGSIESDGKGTMLTTSQCMLSINRNGIVSKEDVERELRRSLGARRVLWINHGALEGDDTDSHVDTLARFAPDDTILYVKSYRSEDPHTRELELMEQELKQMRTAQGKAYNLIGLPLPDPIFDEEGERLPATYANFLITPHAVLMPTYAQPRNDEMARQMLQIAFPGHEILTVDCRPLIRQHGSLHCATMQLPSTWLPV